MKTKMGGRDGEENHKVYTFNCKQLTGNACKSYNFISKTCQKTQLKLSLTNQLKRLLFNHIYIWSARQSPKITSTTGKKVSDKFGKNRMGYYTDWGFLGYKIPQIQIKLLFY